MIVLSQSLVLAASDIPAGTPWIGWNNVATPSNVLAELSAIGYPGSNLGNPMTHLRWKDSGGPGGAEIFIWVQSVIGSFDYLAVAGHNFGSGGNTLRVVSFFGAAQTQVIDPVVLPDDAPVIFHYPEMAATDIVLYVGPGSLQRSAAVLYCGNLLTMERGIKVDVDHVPVKYGRKAKVVGGMSESGNFLGRIVTQDHRESKANFSHITPDWYRSTLDPFVAASKTTPFFFAWNPNEYPLETGYCCMTNDPMPEINPVTRRVSIDFEMRGVT